MPVDACILLVRWLCKGAEGWTNVESTVAHRTKRGTFFLSHWRECMPKMQSINQSTWRIGQRVSQGTLGPKLPMRWHSSREIYPSQLLVNWVLSPSSFCKVESKLKSSGGGMGDVSGINTKRYHWNFVFARGKWGRPKYLALRSARSGCSNSKSSLALIWICVWEWSAPRAPPNLVPKRHRNSLILCLVLSTWTWDIGCLLYMFSASAVVYFLS